MLTLDFIQDLADVMKKHGIKKITPACNGFAKPCCKCTGFLGLFKKRTPCYGCNPNDHRIGFRDDGGFEFIGMNIVAYFHEERREGE